MRSTTMMKTLAGLATLALLALGTGCAGPSPSGTEEFLAAYGLEGKDATTIVDELEVATEDRTAGPVGSVRPDELVLSDDEHEVSLPIEDWFYLSIAPYVDQTHDCFFHNLATCQGELVEEDLQVRITDGNGATVLDEQVTTHANGFAGLWLPRGLEGTITVSHDGKQVTAPVGTGADDPTCLTTLQLTEA